MALPSLACDVTETSAFNPAEPRRSANQKQLPAQLDAAFSQSEAAAGTVGRSAVGAADPARRPPSFQPSQRILTPETRPCAPEVFPFISKIGRFHPKRSRGGETAPLVDFRHLILASLRRLPLLVPPFPAEPRRSANQKPPPALLDAALWEQRVLRASRRLFNPCSKFSPCKRRFSPPKAWIPPPKWRHLAPKVPFVRRQRCFELRSPADDVQASTSAFIPAFSGELDTLSQSKRAGDQPKPCSYAVHAGSGSCFPRPQIKACRPHSAPRFPFSPHTFSPPRPQSVPRASPTPNHRPSVGPMDPHAAKPPPSASAA